MVIPITVIYQCVCKTLLLYFATEVNGSVGESSQSRTYNPLHTGQFITKESNNNEILIIDSIRNTVAMLRADNHLMFENLSHEYKVNNGRRRSTLLTT